MVGLLRLLHLKTYLIAGPVLQRTGGAILSQVNGLRADLPPVVSPGNLRTGQPNQRPSPAPRRPLTQLSTCVYELQLLFKNTVGLRLAAQNLVRMRLGMYFENPVSAGSFFSLQAGQLACIRWVAVFRGSAPLVWLNLCIRFLTVFVFLFCRVCVFVCFFLHKILWLKRSALTACWGFARAVIGMLTHGRLGDFLMFEISESTNIDVCYHWIKWRQLGNRLYENIGKGMQVFKRNSKLLFFRGLQFVLSFGRTMPHVVMGSSANKLGPYKTSSPVSGTTATTVSSFGSSLAFFVDPGFGGEDGEPELQYEAFVYAFSKDRERFKRRETKRFKLQDPYALSLLTPQAEKSRRAVSRMFHRMLGTKDADERFEFIKHYMSVMDDHDQELPDETLIFKSLPPGSLAPSGREVPLRAQQVAEFLSKHPMGRFISNRGSAVEPFGGATPYSFGSRHNRYAFGHRQPNIFYKFIQLFGGSDTRYLNPAILSSITSRIPWERGEKPDLLVRARQRPKTNMLRRFHQQVPHVKYDNYLNHKLPSVGLKFGREVRQGYGANSIHELPVVVGHPDLYTPKNLTELRFLPGVSVKKPLDPKYFVEYVDPGESDIEDGALVEVGDDAGEEEFDVWFEDAQDEEEYYHDIRSRHTNPEGYNTTVAFQPPASKRVGLPLKHQISSWFETLTRSRAVSLPPEVFSSADVSAAPERHEQSPVGVLSLPFETAEKVLVTGICDTEPENLLSGSAAWVGDIHPSASPDRSTYKNVGASCGDQLTTKTNDKTDTVCRSVEADLINPLQKQTDTEVPLAVPGDVRDCAEIPTAGVDALVGSAESEISKKQPLDVVASFGLPNPPPAVRQLRPIENVYTDPSWLSGADRLSLMLFDSVKDDMGMTAVASLLFPWLAEQYERLNIPFHGGTMPADRPVDTLTAWEWSDLFMRWAAQQDAAEAARKAALAPRYIRLGVADFVRLTIDNAIFQYSYAFHHLRWANRKAHLQDMPVWPARVIKNLGLTGSRSAIQPLQLGRGVSTKIQHFSFDAMDGQLSVSKPPYFGKGGEAGRGACFRIKPETHLEFRRVQQQRYERWCANNRVVTARQAAANRAWDHFRGGSGVVNRLARQVTAPRDPLHTRSSGGPAQSLRTVTTTDRQVVGAAPTIRPTVTNGVDPLDPSPNVPLAPTTALTAVPTSIVDVPSELVVSPSGDCLPVDNSGDLPALSDEDVSFLAERRLTPEHGLSPTLNISSVTEGDLIVPAPGGTLPAAGSAYVLPASPRESFFIARSGLERACNTGLQLPISVPSELPVNAYADNVLDQDLNDLSVSGSQGDSSVVVALNAEITPHGIVLAPTYAIAEHGGARLSNSHSNRPVAASRTFQPDIIKELGEVDFSASSGRGAALRLAVDVPPRGETPPVGPANVNWTSIQLQNLTSRTDSFRTSAEESNNNQFDIAVTPSGNNLPVSSSGVPQTASEDLSFETARSTFSLHTVRGLSPDSAASAPELIRGEGILSDRMDGAVSAPLPSVTSKNNASLSQLRAVTGLVGVPRQGQLWPLFRRLGLDDAVGTGIPRTDVAAPNPQGRLTDRLRSIFAVSGPTRVKSVSPADPQIGFLTSDNVLSNSRSKSTTLVDQEIHPTTSESVPQADSVAESGRGFSRPRSPGLTTPASSASSTPRPSGELSAPDESLPNSTSLSKAHDATFKVTVDGTFSQPSVGGGYAYAPDSLHDPIGFVVSAVAGTASHLASISWGAAFTACTPEWLANFSVSDVPQLNMLVERGQTLFNHVRGACVVSKSTENILGDMPIGEHVDAFIDQQLRLSSFEGRTVSPLWAQVCLADRSLLENLFPGFLGSESIVLRPLEGLTRDELQVFNTAVMVLTDERVTDVLDLAAKSAALPELRHLFNKTLQTALDIRRSAGMDMALDFVQLRSEIRARLHKLVANCLLTSFGANGANIGLGALTSAEKNELVLKALESVLVCFDPTQVLRGVLLQNTWSFVKNETIASGFYTSDRWDDAPNLFTLTAVQALSSVQESLPALGTASRMALSDCIATLLAQGESTSPNLLFGVLGSERARCRAVLLDFFLINLFQGSAASQEFVDRHSKMFIRWLDTPPIELVRLVGRCGVSDLGFKSMLLGVGDGGRDLFFDHLSQFGGQGATRFDFVSFKAQALKAFSQLTDPSVIGVRPDLVLPALCESAGLSHTNTLSQPIYTEPVVSSTPESAAFGLVLQPLASDSADRGMRANIADLVATVADTANLSAHSTGLSELGTLGYNYAVEQVATLLTKPSSELTTSWALTPGAERLALGKTWFNLARAGVDTPKPGFDANTFFPLTESGPSTVLQASAVDRQKESTFLVQDQCFVTHDSDHSAPLSGIVRPKVTEGHRVTHAFEVFPTIAERSGLTLDSSISLPSVSEDRSVFSADSVAVPSTQIGASFLRTLCDRSKFRPDAQYEHLNSLLRVLVSTPPSSRYPGLLESLHDNTLQFVLQPSALQNFRQQLDQIQTPREVLQLVQSILTALPHTVSGPQHPFHKDILLKFPTLGLGLLPERVALPTVLLELPARLQLRFSQPEAVRLAADNWHSSNIPLVEKCYDSIARLLLHYSGSVDQSVRLGRPWHDAVLEFIRLQSTIQTQLDTLAKLVAAKDKVGISAFAAHLLTLELKVLSDPTRAQLVLTCNAKGGWDWEVTNLPPSLGNVAPDLVLMHYATVLDSASASADVRSSFAQIALGLVVSQVSDESFGSPIYCNSRTALNLPALEKLAALSYSEGSRIVFTPELLTGLTVPSGAVRPPAVSFGLSLTYHRAMELVALSALNPGQERYDQLILELGLLISAPELAYGLNRSDIERRWQKVEAREGVVFDIIVTILHSMRAHGLCDVVEVGHLARQAFVSLAYGDRGLSDEVLAFWYNLACNPRVTLFTGMSSTSPVSLQLDAAHTLLDFSLYSLKRGTYTKNLPARGYDLVLSVIGLAKHKSELSSTDLAVRILPRLAEQLQSCDLSPFNIEQASPSESGIQTVFVDPVFGIAQLVRAAQVRIREKTVEPTKVVLELLGASARLLEAGPVAVQPVSATTASFTHTPVWEHTTPICQRLLELSAKQKLHYPVTLCNVWDSIGLATEGAAKHTSNAVSPEILQVVGPWLKNPSLGYIPPSVLEQIAARGCETSSVHTASGIFALPVPLRVGDISITHLPTVQAVFPQSSWNPPLDVYYVLGPLLLNLYLLNRPENWQFFFETNKDLALFCDSFRFTDLQHYYGRSEKLQSVIGDVGGAYDYIKTTPSHTGLESFEPRDRSAVVELFRIASGEIGHAFMGDRPPTASIISWGYQWVWEFYYQTDGGAKFRQTNTNGVSVACQDAFRAFLQQKITIYKNQTQSSLPYQGEVNSAISEASRVGSGFFDARTLFERLEAADALEAPTMVTLLRYLVPESAILARHDRTFEGGLLGPVRKFRGYGYGGYDTDTVTAALTAHCHTTPGPEFFPKRFKSPHYDRIALSHCFQRERPAESYTYEDFIPRAIGRDAIQPHYNVIISNPVARKWFTARRRMDKITLTHEMETTTSWRFGAWFERRKMEHKSEMLYISELFWNYIFRTDYGCLIADICEVVTSPHFTAFNILKVYLNYWVIRVFVPLWYIQRRIWEHRDNAPNFEFLGPTERPLGKLELLVSDIDTAQAAAVYQNSMYHDLLYMFSALAILVGIYYWYMSYLAAKELHESVFSLSIYHVPLRYLERADWYEVREDRDNSHLVKKHFPDFEYMTKADEDTIHLANVTKYVDYDNIWLSIVDKPEADIYFGPRYIDEETLCDTIEIVGYESPDWTGTRQTDIKEINFWDIGVVDSQIESTFIDKFKRKSNWWIWDQEVTPLANQPGIEYEDLVDVMYLNYHRVFLGRLNGFARSVAWVIFSTSWFWAASLCVFMAEACMRSDLSFWSMPLSLNTIYSPQFWFEWFVTRGLPMVTPSVARNRLFHFLEYLEYNFPTNVHRPDWFTNLYDHNEKANVEDAYALNFGLDFSELTPEDTTRILRASEAAPIYSPHRFFVGRERAVSRELSEQLDDFNRVLSRPFVDSYIRSLSSGIDIFKWTEGNTSKVIGPWIPFGDGFGALEEVLSPGNFFYTQLSDWIPQFYQPRRPWARNFKTNRDWFWRNVYNAPAVDPVVGPARTAFVNFSHVPNPSVFDPQDGLKYYEPLSTRKYIFDWSDAGYTVPSGVILNTNFKQKGVGFDIPKGVRQLRYQTRRAAMPLKNIKRVMDSIYKGPRPYAPLEYNNIQAQEDLVSHQNPDSEFLQRYGHFEPRSPAFFQYQPIPAFGEYSPTSVNLELVPVTEVYSSQDWWVQPDSKHTKLKQTSPWVALWKNSLRGTDPRSAHRLASLYENSAEWYSNWNLRRLGHLPHFKRNARARRNGLAAEFRRTDSDLDSLTNFAATSAALDLQPSGTESTKPHLHWVFDTAAQLYDLDSGTHTSGLPIGDSRVQELLWTLRRWAGPISGTYHAANTAELLHTNEEILENQGISDYWPDPTVRDAGSRRLRADFRRASETYTDSQEIPSRAYAYFVPLVDPFFKSWRSRAARWVVSFIPEQWFGRGTADISARYIGRDALPYDFRAWELDPITFANLTAPTMSDLQSDQQLATPLGDIGLTKPIGTQRWGLGRFKVPNQMLFDRLRYSILTIAKKRQATIPKVGLENTEGAQYPLQQINDQWSFSPTLEFEVLPTGVSAPLLQDVSVLGALVSPYRVDPVGAEDWYIAEAERLMVDMRRAGKLHLPSGAISESALAEIVDLVRARFEFVSNYLSGLVTNTLPGPNSGALGSTAIDLASLSENTSRRVSGATGRFYKSLHPRLVQPVLAPETITSHPVVFSYTAGKFVSSQFWGGIVSCFEAVTFSFIAACRYFSTAVSRTSRALGFFKSDFRTTRAVDNLSALAGSDRHDTLRLWFGSVRQFKVLADLRLHSTRASAEVPTFFAFVEDNYSVPLTGLVTRLRELSYRRKARSSAFQQKFSLSLDLPAVGVTRWRQMGLSVIHLVAETVETWYNSTLTLVDRNPGSRVLRARYLVGTLGWGIGALELLFWPVKVLALLGLEVASLGSTVFQVVALSAASLGRLGWLIFGLVRQTLFGTLSTLFSCSTGILSYIFSVAEATTHTVIWGCTHLYLTVVDVCFAVTYFSRFLAETVIVAAYRTLLGTVHAVADTLRTAALRTIHAGGIALDQLEVFRPTEGRKRHMRFVGPYLYRKRPLSDQAHRFASLLFRTVVDFYLAICDSFEYLAFQMQLFKSRCKVLATVRYWRFCQVFGVYTKWIGRWFSPRSLFGASSLSGLFSDSPFWSRGAWSDTFYTGVGFSRFSSSRQTKADARPGKSYQFWTSRARGAWSVRGHNALTPVDNYWVKPKTFTN